MARYVLASTARALPGWLTFSTAIRVLALGLPFSDGRSETVNSQIASRFSCSVLGAFTCRSTECRRRDHGNLRETSFAGPLVNRLPDHVDDRLAAASISAQRISSASPPLPPAITTTPAAATDDSCKALTKAARAGRSLTESSLHSITLVWFETVGQLLSAFTINPRVSALHCS